MNFKLPLQGVRQARKPGRVFRREGDLARFFAQQQFRADQFQQRFIFEPQLGGQSQQLLDEQPLAAGTVQFVSPVVTAATDTVLVRLALPKASGLRPGKFAAVRIATEERAGKLAVPHESVVTDSEGHTTISIVEGEVAKQKAVQVGLRDGDLVEISGEGINEGATVVTVGSYGLPKETKVRIAAPAAKEAAK